MDHFHYKNAVYHCEDVSLEQLAAQLPTPFYCYSKATLARHFRVMDESFTSHDHMICYALKANANVDVLQALAEQGAGADIVSGGELALALENHIPPHRIVFSGVGKTKPEMVAALSADIFQFNVESEPELRALSQVATSMNITARIAVRVNPDVDAATHAKISTGHKESKFGVEMSEAPALYALARTLSGIQVQGVSVHIGSQLTTLAPFAQAFARVAEFVKQLRGEGHVITTLDLGGGLGIPYGPEDPPLPAEYAALVKREVGDLSCKFIFEPGRLIVGNAGVLVTRVIYVKKSSARTFVIVDAGMNDLMRPALYGAHHEIVPVAQAQGALANADIVGPVCESSDVFAESRPMPPLKEGNLLAIRSCGAYGASMASTYNARPLVAEVTVDGVRWTVRRKAIIAA